ncbi:MAG TPA: hypothetical protein VFE36_01400, partial [Candidatus Baltobacteraceae bacterium]|nr:hypothetical protein [Candidatus Baltobacteraceae bacterium]
MMKLLRRLRRRPADADPGLARTVLGAMREDRGRFADLRNARVLLYWPHGLGDWVHLGAIAPLLEQSNAYAITRFGDDYVSVMEGNRFLTPLRSGVSRPGDGTELGAKHFGITLDDCNGRKVSLALPCPLDEEILRFAPEALLWTDYPETEGRSAYPFHTKARNLARLLVRRERLQGFDLSQPLPSTIDFSVPDDLRRRIDERLARFAPAGSRIAVVSRAGVTAARKNWGDGSEFAVVAAALVQRDPRWRFISMDEETPETAVVGFRALFGDIDEPFGRVLKAVFARTDLTIAVPAGPLHVAMARGAIPIVGLWIAHHPDWYDEPNPNAVHLVGRYV